MKYISIDELIKLTLVSQARCRALLALCVILGSAMAAKAPKIITTISNSTSVMPLLFFIALNLSLYSFIIRLHRDLYFVKKYDLVS